MGVDGTCCSIVLLHSWQQGRGKSVTPVAPRNSMAQKHKSNCMVLGGRPKSRHGLTPPFRSCASVTYSNGWLCTQIDVAGHLRQHDATQRYPIDCHSDTAWM